jgi:hypothetical protein
MASPAVAKTPGAMSFVVKDGRVQIYEGTVLRAMLFLLDQTHGVSLIIVRARVRPHIEEENGNHGMTSQVLRCTT